MGNLQTSKQLKIDCSKAVHFFPLLCLASLFQHPRHDLFHHPGHRCTYLFSISMYGCDFLLNSEQCPPSTTWNLLAFACPVFMVKEGEWKQTVREPSLSYPPCPVCPEIRLSYSDGMSMSWCKKTS